MQTSSSIPARSAQQGFTLIEVIIALALLVIGILAAGAMQLHALRGNFQAKRILQSVTGHVDVLERFINLSYGDPLLQKRSGNPNTVAGLDVGSGRSGLPLAPQQADGFSVVSDNGRNMTVFWNVADNYPLVGCKTIRVFSMRDDMESAGKVMAMDFIKMKQPGSMNDDDQGPMSHDDFMNMRAPGP